MSTGLNCGEIDEPAVHGLALDGHALEVPPIPPSAPLGHAPARRTGSIRRTASLDVSWPEGRHGPSVITGRGRDLLTGSELSRTSVIDSVELTLQMRDRKIESITSTPPRPGLESLIGLRAAGQVRGSLEQAIPGDKAAGSLTYLLLDDLAGVSLVSSWAWSVWVEDFLANLPPEKFREHARRMENVCIGYRTGSSALVSPQPGRARQNKTRVVSVANPEDPIGWHELPSADGCHFRRARRIDLWREHDRLMIDAMFQDSAALPGEDLRLAVHEYGVRASADALDGSLLSVETHAGTLPFVECPAAQANAPVMVGTALTEMREATLVRLRRTAGCTHLNDALRALADVPPLASALPARHPGERDAA